MRFEDKKIYLALSPHINYYHSYRGDSRGISGFGKDLILMRGILDKLNEIEDMDFSFKSMKISWDYADLFWSIQLQKEYQQDVLDRVIERCRKKKDEILIGSWGNVAQPILDTEALLQDQKWFLENSMGIGVNQLFKGRVAPYARTQETMYTQGMIEIYNKLGIKGICIYYSVYQFDVARPFLNPRLDWNQQFGPVKLRSAVSDANCLMIPMYGFGDILDYCSIKRWFKIIRKAQKKGDIKGHALIFLNFDMDYDLWLSVPLPSFLKWMPNTRGLLEFAEVVDQLDYVEFASLLEVIPKLEIRGETILREDAADGSFNGFYSWAQKHDNTRFWTVGQWARWVKCMTDTLVLTNNVKIGSDQINRHLRKGDDQSNTYLKNMILFCSTTNFGLSMPFQHPHRQKTAMSYGLNALIAALKAMKVAKENLISQIKENNSIHEPCIWIFPIIHRGITPEEKKQVKYPILIRSELPNESYRDLLENKDSFYQTNFISDGVNHVFYKDPLSSNLSLEAIIPPEKFEKINNYYLSFTFQQAITQKSNKNELQATRRVLKNKFIRLEFDENGKIISFKLAGKEYACPKFLDSAVVFGTPKKSKRYESLNDEIVVLRTGEDNFSASLKIKSVFEILPNALVHVEKTCTIYADLPFLFIDVEMNLCDIKGDEKIEDGTSFVEKRFDKRWLEIMPCEIRPQILGIKNFLRIWKHNYFGRVSFFDLDMKQVDPKNANFDCLVANISDGWMGVSNGDKGLLVGYNGIKAANFAFTPLKLRDKGFGDCAKEAQQIRINPFGTYHGKSLHYWTNGTGHGQKLVPKLFTTLDSSAPTFSGKKVSFELVLIPYKGDFPPLEFQSFLNHFSLPPLLLYVGKQQDEIQDNYSYLESLIKSLIKEFDIEELMEMTYIDWVRKINADFDENKELKFPKQEMKLDISSALLLLIDGIRGKL
ncbi:MAG: hypothetical protein ACTSYC_11090 [Promethearchaeota archaeon]